MALATSRAYRLVTADKVLYRGLKHTALQKHLLWIEDVAAQK